MVVKKWNQQTVKKEGWKECNKHVKETLLMILMKFKQMITTIMHNPSILMNK